MLDVSKPPEKDKFGGDAVMRLVKQTETAIVLSSPITLFYSVLQMSLELVGIHTSPSLNSLDSLCRQR